VIICVERGADCLHMVQLMPLPSQTPSSLALFKSILVVPFWYRLTQVVLEKSTETGVVVVVVVWCVLVGWAGCGSSWRLPAALSLRLSVNTYTLWGGSVAEWLACWTQA